MAELLAQQLLELAEGEAGLGDLDLDLRAPVVLERLGRAFGVGGGRLEGLQLVEEPAGGDLASQAIADKVRRDRKGVDREARGLVRLPGHGRDQRHGAKADQHGHQLQQGLEPVAETAPAQAREHQLALLVQMLLLQAGQLGLLVQEGIHLRIGRAGRLGPAPPDRQRSRRGQPRARRVGALAFDVLFPFSQARHAPGGNG